MNYTLKRSLSPPERTHPRQAAASDSQYLASPSPVSDDGPEGRRYLIAHYREDILNLASLVDRGLSAWLQ
jgi:hypothetical protein